MGGACMKEYIAPEVRVTTLQATAQLAGSDVEFNAGELEF